MSIWHTTFPIAHANERGATCANGHLGIEMLEAGDDYLRGRMPVDARTRQPAGVLHGGVSVVFAETLASWASAYVVNPEETTCAPPPMAGSTAWRGRCTWAAPATCGTCASSTRPTAWSACRA